MNKFIRIFSIHVASLSLLETACQADAPTEEPRQNLNPIKIRASLPLSSRFSELVTAAKQGYQVWASTVNKSKGLLGRPVELKILDKASEQEAAADQYENLTTKEKVDLVVGPFSSFLVIPTSHVTAKHGDVFVEPAGTLPKHSTLTIFVCHSG